MFGKNKTYFLFLFIFCSRNSFTLDPISAAESFTKCSDAADFLESVDAAKAAFSDVAEGVSGETLSAAWAALKERNPTFFAACSDLGILYQIHSIASDTKSIACTTYSYFFPTKKDASASLEVDEMYDILMAKKLLEACLIKNARGKRAASGRPEVCEEAARMFVMLGGEKVLDKITNKYNKAREAYAA